MEKKIVEIKKQVSTNGFVYEVIKKGSGKAVSLNEYAYFNAVVASHQGDILFSSSDNGQPAVLKLEDPATSPQPNPISEVLIGGNVGDSIHIFINKDQGAGGSGHDSIIYQIGLTKCLDEAAYQVQMAEDSKIQEAKLAEAKLEETVIATKVAGIYADIKSGKNKADIVTTESGLQYIFHEKGTGSLPEIGKNVKVNYYGILSRTGEEFDNSWKRGTHFAFPLGQGRVIKGWDEGVALLPIGSKATLIIPGELGYGERGSGKIKANDELIFYIEVE